MGKCWPQVYKLMQSFAMGFLVFYGWAVYRGRTALRRTVWEKCSARYCPARQLAGLKALPHSACFLAWSPLRSSGKMDHRRGDGEGTQTRGGVVVTFKET